MWDEGVIEWYHNMVHPLDWMGSVCWSCIHVGFTCVTHPCGLYACCICMVIVMIVVMLSCESEGVVVECVIMSV